MKLQLICALLETQSTNMNDPELINDLIAKGLLTATAHILTPKGLAYVRAMEAMPFPEANWIVDHHFEITLLN